MFRGEVKGIKPLWGVFVKLRIYSSLRKLLVCLLKNKLTSQSQCCTCVYVTLVHSRNPIDFIMKTKTSVFFKQKYLPHKFNIEFVCSVFPVDSLNFRPTVLDLLYYI